MPLRLNQYTVALKFGKFTYFWMLFKVTGLISQFNWHWLLVPVPCSFRTWPIHVHHVCFRSSMLHWLLGHLFRGRNEKNDVLRVWYACKKQTKGESLATSINKGTSHDFLSAVTVCNSHCASVLPRSRNISCILAGVLMLCRDFSSAFISWILVHRSTVEERQNILWQHRHSQVFTALNLILAKKLDSYFPGVDPDQSFCVLCTHALGPRLNFWLERFICQKVKHVSDPKIRIQ